MGIRSKIFLKSAIAAILSMLATLSIAFVIVPELGGSVDGIALLMCVVCPLIVGGPASAFQFWQNDKLHRARDELAKTHGQLDRMHRDLMSAHVALSEKARRDGMTGLLNRESFFEAMQTMLDGGCEGTLVFVDADHFKSINDTFGHHAGDVTLKAIASTIADATHDGNFAGRIGGEEFAVFLAGADYEGHAQFAEGIRAQIADLEINCDGTLVPVTVSIGGSSFKGQIETTALCRAADRNLYSAKHQGRNRVVMSFGASFNDTAKATELAKSAVIAS
jgi:diguanylate cyclase (GGDEF)-like protein